MKSLLADYKPPIGEYKVGGIPVDSEYIIFIIDTSGSMKNYAWTTPSTSCARRSTCTPRSKASRS